MRPGDALLEAMTGLARCVQTSYRGRPLDETKEGNGAGGAVGRRGCWEGGAADARLRSLFWRKSHFSLVNPSKSPFEGYLLFLSLLCGVGPFWQSLTKKGGRMYREGLEVLPACPSQLLPTSLDKCQAPLGHRTCLAALPLAS